MKKKKKKYSIRGENIYFKKRRNISSHYIPITLFRNASNLNRLNVGRKEMITCHGNPHSAAHAVTCLCTLTGHDAASPWRTRVCTNSRIARLPSTMSANCTSLLTRRRLRPRCVPRSILGVTRNSSTSDATGR